MDRRKETRIEIDQEVTVTVLGAPDSAPFKAVAVDMSGSGLRIVSPQPVSYQAAVKVQAGDLLVLGEVIRVQQSDQGCVLALKLQHSLDSLSDLHRLNRALHWEERKVEEPSLEELLVLK